MTVFASLAKFHRDKQRIYKVCKGFLKGVTMCVEEKSTRVRACKKVEIG